MRLLHFDQHGELSLTKNLDYNIPPYAILSHTWGDDDDEVTFDDLQQGLDKSKVGYAKLQFCGNQARKDKLDYFWVDTCCINKANLVELSEAITSMFAWYRDAVKCYVYLSDVTAPACNRDDQTKQAWQPAFRTSRWFTRGWTLQELLAPSCVEFFSREESLLGDRRTLEHMVHEITGVPVAALQGTPLSTFSIDERLLWATNRNTKKKEDKAYCLLGIFGVFMPLIYGEGENAFVRLQEEIAKRSNEKRSHLPSPSSTVPFRRDIDFVDRESLKDGTTLLEQIEQHCAAPAARVALVGIGGAGKSQLAIEYCHRMREQSPDTWTFWVHAGNLDRMEQGYREIAERVRIPNYEDPKQNIFELVARWLRDETKGRWVLVLDNIDDEAILSIPQVNAQPGKTGGQSQQPLSKYLPQSQNGRILITTRTMSVATKLVGTPDVIPVRPMVASDAIELLRKKLGGGRSDNDLHELATILEYMPLALVQAAAYIRSKGARCNIRRYIETFQESEKKRKSLLDYEAGQLRRDPDAKNSIIITWQISFDDIRKNWPAASDLLSLMCYFDRQGIPEEALRVRVQDEDSQDPAGPEYGSAEEDKEDGDRETAKDSASETSNDDGFEEAIDRLQSYCFVSIGEDGSTFEMHRLVQLAMRKWLEMHKQDEKWKAQFYQKLEAVFPSGEYQDWSRCEMFFPHAKSAETQRPAGVKSVRLWASIMLRASWYAWTKGDYAEAGRMCELLTTVLRRTLDEDDVQISYGLSVLAAVYLSQHRYSEAESVAVQAFETRKEALGEEHVLTLGGMNNLAVIYEKQDRQVEAEELLVQVVEVRRRVHGEEHPDTLTAIHNLGAIYKCQGRWVEAEKLITQTLEVRRKVLGEQHPDTLECMNNLADTYSRQERWTEAEGIQRQAFAASKEVLGDNHPGTLMSMNNLAFMMKGHGRIAEAIDLMTECVRLSIVVMGAQDQNTLNRVARLALFESLTD